MTKAQFISAVKAKSGYVAILADNVAPDSVKGAIKEKRYLVVETLNSDGTKGQTHVYYIHDTENDTAWFYNVEPASFQKEAKSIDQQTLDALNAYCKATFAAYFLIPERIDATNKWAVVEGYTLISGKLAKKNYMVYKTGTDPIAHVEIV
jgi:hypothetical protein